MAVDFMVNQALLRNRFDVLTALFLGLCGCQPASPTSIAIPALYVSVNQPGWQKQEGRVWRNDKPFSGWQYQLSTTGDTLFVGAFSKGKAEGFHRQWYANRRLKEVRHYKTGWQEGEQRGWFESGRRAFLYQFRNDLYEGTRQEWYATGQPALYGHYHEGQENGTQRQWFANGTLKVNYVARNGRNYGFTGVKNCVSVWDSIPVSH